jgi:hypothetical protein
LAEQQCASFQGFLCSPGLPAAQFEQRLATGRWGNASD